MRLFYGISFEKNKRDRKDILFVSPHLNLRSVSEKTREKSCLASRRFLKKFGIEQEREREREREEKPYRWPLSSLSSSPWFSYRFLCDVLKRLVFGTCTLFIFLSSNQTREKRRKTIGHYRTTTRKKGCRLPNELFVI
jgi:hypothetical protein